MVNPMILLQEEHDQFFKLIFSLLLYVNRVHQVIPGLVTRDDYLKWSREEKFLLREFTFENINCIDDYVHENPDNLAKDELNIIKSWKRFVAGDFVIERLLKKYAIFIQGDDVYAVHALGDSFETLLGGVNPPILVNTILLPFKDKIIYDGWLTRRPIIFGKGIRDSYKEKYLRAKQNDRIIESILPQASSNNRLAKGKPITDWSSEIQELSNHAQKIRARSGDPAIFNPTFSMLKASLKFSKMVVDSSDDIEALQEAFDPLIKSINKVISVLNRYE
jgi:hypothetical protein